MTTEIIKKRGDYSIVKETDDDGTVRYIVYGPDGTRTPCSTLEDAEAELDRLAGPEYKSPTPFDNPFGD